MLAARAMAPDLAADLEHITRPPDRMQMRCGLWRRMRPRERARWLERRIAEREHELRCCDARLHGLIPRIDPSARATYCGQRDWHSDVLATLRFRHALIVAEMQRRAHDR